MLTPDRLPMQGGWVRPAADITERDLRTEIATAPGSSPARAGPPDAIATSGAQPGIFRASALTSCGHPPSIPPGQPRHPEDPDSTIHVRKTVTIIAEDDPYRLVTLRIVCGG